MATTKQRAAARRARRLNIRGRSKLGKSELGRAVSRAKG
jgi:hypothetical protein